MTKGNRNKRETKKRNRTLHFSNPLLELLAFPRTEEEAGRSAQYRAECKSRIGRCREIWRRCLTIDEWKVVEMYILGWSVTEIANDTGMSRWKIKRSLSFAVCVLKSSLEKGAEERLQVFAVRMEQAAQCIEAGCTKVFCRYSELFESKGFLALLEFTLSRLADAGGEKLSVMFLSRIAKSGCGILSENKRSMLAGLLRTSAALARDNRIQADFLSDFHSYRSLFAECSYKGEEYNRLW